MATKPTTPRIDIAKVLSKRGYGAELQRIREREQTSRDARAHRILGTGTISERDIDAAKLLMTTLGGQPRAITLQDLETFSASARKLGKRYKGGITAKGVIDHSLQVDRGRANTEIRTAVVTRAQAGILHFITNAGPDSDVHRHHVNIEFPNFKAHAASPIKADRQARTMLDGPIKFECDCGRFRYWYRALCTMGGFVAGRLEPSFPRIRNPKLAGVACKHALRVMQAVMKDANVRAQAAKMIGAAQKNDTRAQTVSAADAKAAAQRQLEAAHHAKNRVETAQQMADRRAKTPAGKARALAAATKEAERRAAAAIDKSRRELDRAFAKLQAAPMTKAMRDALIAKLMAATTTD